MTMLSTIWKNVWLQHGRLVFDQDFFESIRKYVVANSTSAVNIINNILLLRRGPIKKFTLNIFLEPKLQQSDIERWCHFLSRNVIEELTLHLFVVRSTLKLPSNFILVFDSVELKWSVNGVSSTIPNLEKLAFLGGCEGMDKFEIIAPKLESLSHISAYSGFEPRWFALQLKRIKSLCLSGTWRCAAAVLNSSTAINLQIMELHHLRFSCEKQIATAMALLQKSPNLCELGIRAGTPSWSDYEEDALKHLEDLDHYFINQDMKMFSTVKIEGFNGSRFEVLFVKSVFTKCPALERVVIHPAWIGSITYALMGMNNILRELTCFHRASPNAQLVILEHKSTNNLVGYNAVDDI
ncbi:uncharacterized protein LOC116024272 [Ipomoea triloba]|uniref:uncharacterized protein LOC116024272 n=1 Tax=Ipomoea triloba TaxID=35885 RepID=UPI00125D90F6|nr:uncharacterized protein LOC116024272 [Ipomoea triloba]